MIYARCKRTNVVWVYLHEEAKVVKFIDTEIRMVVARGWKKGE
jgi:hypothetical protein